MQKYSWKYGNKRGSVEAESMEQAWNLVVKCLDIKDLTDDHTLSVKPVNFMVSYFTQTKQEKQK